MDYNVNVNIKGKEKIDALEKQLNTLSKKPVKIAVDIDSKNVDTALNKMSKSAEKHKIKPTVDTSGLKELEKFTKAFGGIQHIQEIIGQMAAEVLNINAAMTELQKVSNATDAQLSSCFAHAVKSANHYGTAVSDMINSAADWSKLGYGLEEIKKLSDAAALLQRIGGNMPQKSSAEGLLSAMKGFGKDADEALSIVDKVTQVANTQPIDISNLFTGLANLASSMGAANNTLEQTISLIAAASLAVQNIDSVGAAYETISMRLRGAADELAAAGLDTEGMAASVTKLRDELLSLSGVDIMLNTDSLKSTYDILDELSLKWKNLSAAQQSSVTELIAGKSQGDIVPALMKNFDTARETLNTASNGSGGSAEKALSSYQKAMQSSTEALKAQLQGLLSNDFDSNFLLGAIDAGNSFLDILKQIADARNEVISMPEKFENISNKLFGNLDLFYN